jgi:hypothetical protein
MSPKTIAAFACLKTQRHFIRMFWYSLEISVRNVQQIKSDRRNSQFLHGYRSNVLFTLQWDVCVDTHTHTHTHPTHTHTYTHTPHKHTYTHIHTPHTHTHTPLHTHTHTHTQVLHSKTNESARIFQTSLRVVFTCGLSFKMTPFVAVFPPATVTLQSNHMCDIYFNRQEPMKHIGQPVRIKLKQRFCFEGRKWDWWLSFGAICDWAMEWRLELSIWRTETWRYSVLI